MEKPTFKQRLDGLTTFLWDNRSDELKILGRGGRSWAEISFFYIIYYACLAAFFAATLAVFYETVPVDQPKLLSDSSLLAGNPGMGFRPMPDKENHKISAKAGGAGKNKALVEDLTNFLKPYDSQLTNEDCTGVKTTRKSALPCEVDFSKLTKECNEGNEYGFADGKPCVLIKMNKVFGWEPKLWADSDSKIPSAVEAVYDPSVIPVRCSTKDKGDEKKLGTVLYHPQQGFPVSFFPYQKQKDYRAPLIFVQFPNVTKNSGLDIECRIYAKNVNYDRTEMQGSVQFKLNVA